jgi:hypothetical protein
MLDVSVPLSDVGVSFFVSLYEDGKTESSPSRAAEIVFGEAPLDAVERAEEALRRRRR